ncbi:MAG: oxidoreductase [Nitrosomonadaceae bacterium]|nr:oxidoreductase [Nitrosomonadaceae bacterium]
MDSKKRFDLSNRVAVITGGAGLLGKEHASIIAEAGGIPILADVKEEEAKKKAQEISKKFKVPALGVSADITNKTKVEQLLKKLIKKFQRVDILINNAANDPKVDRKNQHSNWSRLENFSLEMWEKDLAVGLTGPFICSQVFGTYMAKQGSGVILNISSDLGLIGPDQRLYEIEGRAPEEQPVKPVTYPVVKTGLIGLTRYLATYWASCGVRINALCPGGVDAGQPQEFKERLYSKIPMGRMANKEEYHGAVLFMVSDESSYMNGAILAIDGGRTCW